MFALALGAYADRITHRIQFETACQDSPIPIQVPGFDSRKGTLRSVTLLSHSQMAGVYAWRNTAGSESDGIQYAGAGRATYYLDIRIPDGDSVHLAEATTKWRKAVVTGYDPSECMCDTAEFLLIGDFTSARQTLTNGAALAGFLGSTVNLTADSTVSAQWQWFKPLATPQPQFLSGVDAIHVLYVIYEYDPAGK